MAHRKTWPRNTLHVATLLLVTLLLVSCGKTGPLAPGAPAPSLEVALLDGSAWDPGRGPVLVNFWATWCLACKVAIPELRNLSETGAVDVVGLALDSDPSKVEGFAAEHAIAYPLALDDGEIFDRFDGLAIPHSVLLGADGRVLAIYRGTVREEKVVDDLRLAGGAS